MWHATFALGVSVGEKVVRALAVYLFLLFALRLLGKRELGQSNTLDLIVLLLVANTVQNGLIGGDNSVTGALLGAAVLFAINRAFSFLAYRFGWAERLLEGTPTTLIQDGRVMRRALRQQEISEADLGAQARRQGFADLGEVEQAILETNGTISMLRREATRAA